MMKAKMKVTDISEIRENGDITTTNLCFQAVTSDAPYGPKGENENNTYARFTPVADLYMSITNPALFGQFQVGDEYYLDFTNAND